MEGVQRQLASSNSLEVDADLRGLFFDPARHAEALGAQAMRSLRRGEHAAAFAFADRFCRTTHNRDAFALILRAEASDGLGDIDGYGADVAAAFKVDPLLPDAARHMLAACKPGSRLEIAGLILRNPLADRRARLDAIAAVLSDGYEIVTDLRFDGRRISGLLAWRLDGGIEVDLSPPPGMNWMQIAPDIGHSSPERGLCVAMLPPVEVGGERDARRAMRAFRARCDERALTRYDVEERQPRRQGSEAPGKTVHAGITVILPVYRDRRLTLLCLLALAKQMPESADVRVLIVDDNPQDSVLTAAAIRLADAQGFDIIRNDRNIGYARSVNRALGMVGSGDVLLLNADVLLPPGAISRLATIARSAPDIGTVTPLSNNGEELSFPSPFHPGPLQSFRRIRELDRVAAGLTTSPVTIVNGVGYCLYITRAALDAVGELPDVYGKGYYEDVDFCLRLRDAGLRNVCATNVYVGHKGAGSFRSDKQVLVARNRRILDRRYPTYMDESAAFVAADPLRTVRVEIERNAVPPRHVASLLIVSPHSIGRVDVFRRALGVRRCLCLTWPTQEPDTSLLWMSDGSSPQSLRFDGPDGRAQVFDYLHAIGVETVYLTGSAFGTGDFVKRLSADGFGIELLFDDSLLQFPTNFDGADCDPSDGMEPCERCIDAFARVSPIERRRGGSSGLDAVLKVTRRVHTMNAMSRALAEHFKLTTMENARDVAPRDKVVSRRTGAAALGLLARGADAATERLLHAIARHTHASRGRIVVIGPCLDAVRYMSWPNVFVTGSVADDEIGRLLDSYGVAVLFAPSRWHGFGDLERHGGGRPKAFFDWSGNLIQAHPLDLALDPRLCDRKVAHRLGEWWQRVGSSDYAQ